MEMFLDHGAKICHLGMRRRLLGCGMALEFARIVSIANVKLS